MTEDRFRTSDGVELVVAESGTGDAPVTAVLLHGWTEDHRAWDRVIRALGGLRVIAPDFRGHGESDPAPKGTATIDRLADDVAELITERAPSGSLVLAGHSLGGMTMMALAARYPELVANRVSGAVFVSTSSGAMHDVYSRLPAPLAAAASLRERIAARRRKARNTKPSGGAKSSGNGTGRGALPVRSKRISAYIIASAVFGESPERADVVATVDQAARTHRGTAAGLSRSMSEHDRADALAAFKTVPAAVIVGERDRLTPLSHARLIADQLPDAEFVVHPGAGHMLPYERPDEVAATIRKLAAELR